MDIQVKEELDLGYDCMHCDTVFHEESEFRLHLQSHESMETLALVHSTATPVANDQTVDKPVSKILEEEERARKIISLVTKEDKNVVLIKYEVDLDLGYSCLHCNTVFSDESEFELHLKSHETVKPKNGKVRKFQCKICKRAFNTKKDLIQHGLVHATDRPFACDQCPGTFKCKRSFKRHMNETHSKERNYKCTGCDKAFKYKLALNRHSVVHMDRIKSYKCTFENCTKSFLSSNNLRIHKQSHTDSNLQCSICSKYYKTSNCLRMHITSVHTAEKKFKCSMCSSAFKYASKLRAHSRMHKPKNPLQCNQCQKAFLRKDRLEKHMLSEHQDN